MNRRNFLKSLTTAIVGLTVAPKLTPIFDELISIGPVGEFEYYVTLYAKVYVYNPGNCGLITNIEN